MTPELFAMLVCPLTRTKLRYDDAQQELISDAARLAFPITPPIHKIMHLVMGSTFRGQGQSALIAKQKDGNA